MYKEHIPISRWKVLLLTLGSLAFVLIGSYFTEFYFIRNGFWFQIFMGILGIIFFGIAFLFGLTKLFDRRSGLILTDEGFLDNSSMTASKFVGWDSILGLSYSKVRSTRFVCVIVKDPEGIIAEHTGFTKFLMRMNYMFIGTPVTISSVMLACSFDELVSKLEEGWELAKIKRSGRVIE